MTDPIDVSKIKAGDVVLVRMNVSAIAGDGDVRCENRSRTGNLWVTPKDIASIEPRPLAVGDRVRIPHVAWTYFIRAVVDDRAMLEPADHIYHWVVMRLSDLERADG